MRDTATSWRTAAKLVTMLVLAAVAVGWLAFRLDDKSWAWWQPPPVLSVSGRQYERGTTMAESLDQAKAGGTGHWVQAATEWPMQWPVWASKLSGAAPTVVFLRTGHDRFVDYGLQGGP